MLQGNACREAGPHRGVHGERAAGEGAVGEAWRAVDQRDADLADPAGPPADGVGDEDGPLGPERGGRQAQHPRVHVHPVGDQRRGHTGVRQRERGHAEVPVVDPAHPVEQVGDQAGPGGHHRVELALRRPGVADAHQHAPLHQQLRRGHCLRLLRTQRHHGHMVGKRCQPVELHRHDPRRIVGARGSPEEWPLQVHPGDRRAAFRRPVHRRPDAGQRRVVAGEGHRHQRRAPGGDALGQQQGVQPLPVRPVGAGHVHVVDPVDLEVDEAGREHPIRRRTRHRRDRLDLRDHRPVPRDPHGAAQPLGCQGEGAFHGRHPSTIS